MNSNAILTANVLDIIFENRNKSYGAYELRSHYQQRLSKAIIITGAFALIFSLLTLLVKSAKSSSTTLIGDTVSIFTLEPPKPEPPVQPKAQPPVDKPEKKILQQQFTDRVKIVTNPLDAPPIKDLLPDAAISGTTSDGGDKPVVSSDPPAKNPITTSSGVVPTEPVAPEAPVFAAEIMPAFPGGTKALYEFFARHLQNPEELPAGTDVQVKVRFVVAINGELMSFEVVQDGGKAFNNEVIRVLKKMPKWNPGKSQGKNVMVYYTVPVTFRTVEE